MVRLNSEMGGLLKWVVHLKLCSSEMGGPVEIGSPTEMCELSEMGGPVEMGGSSEMGGPLKWVVR